MTSVALPTIYAMVNHLDLILKLSRGLVLDPPQFGDLERVCAPQLSETDYFLAIQIFAPNRDVQDVDHELSVVWEAHSLFLDRNRRALCDRFNQQECWFEDVITAYEWSFPAGAIDTDGIPLPEPIEVSRSRVGLRIIHALDPYIRELRLPSDVRREKLTYLLARLFVNNGVAEWLEPEDLPTPLEAVANMLDDFNRAYEMGSSEDSDANESGSTTTEERNSSEDDNEIDLVNPEA